MSERSPHVIDVTDAEFEVKVVERSREVPVVVDLWASWCGPCRTLGPILERVAEERGGSFVLAKVDVDANPGIARAFGVQSIPTVVAMRDGQPVDGFIGALPEPEVNRFVDRVVPSAADVQAARATEEAHGGDPAAAEASFRAVLEGDPDNAAARLGLAELLLDRGEVDEAGSLAGPLRPDPRAERILASIRVAGWATEDDGSAVGAARRLAARGGAPGGGGAASRRAAPTPRLWTRCSHSSRVNRWRASRCSTSSRYSATTRSSPSTADD